MKIAVSIFFSALVAGLSTSLSGRQSTVDESSKYVLPEGSHKSSEPPSTSAHHASAGFYNGRSSAAVTFDQHLVLLDGKVGCFYKRKLLCI